MTKALARSNCGLYKLFSAIAPKLDEHDAIPMRNVIAVDLQFALVERAKEPQENV